MINLRFRILNGWSIASLLLSCSHSSQEPTQTSQPHPDAVARQPSTQPLPAPTSSPSPSLSSSPLNSVTYSLVDEQISDTAVKTQIKQHLLASGLPSRPQLEAELRTRYEAAQARRGFRHSEFPTNIFIYIYGTEEQARAGQGLWLGMISKVKSDASPRLAVAEDRLSALSAPPEARFGLPEARRKAAFKAIVAAEVRATKDAREKVPDSQIMKQIDLEVELKAKYKKAVEREYRVTGEQLHDIGVEGVTKGWPQ